MWAIPLLLLLAEPTGSILHNRLGDSLLVYYPFTEGAGAVAANKASEYGGVAMGAGLFMASATGGSAISWLADTSGIDLASGCLATTNTGTSFVDDLLPHFGGLLDTSFTVEVWVEAAEEFQDRSIVSINSAIPSPTCPMSTAFDLRQRGNGTVVNIAQKDSTQFCDSTTVGPLGDAPRNLHHVVATIPVRNRVDDPSDGPIKVYVDLQLVSDPALPLLATDFTSNNLWASMEPLNFRFGCDWSGRLYQFALYGKALSAAEMAQNFNVFAYDRAPVADVVHVVALEDGETCVTFTGSDVDVDDVLTAVLTGLPAASDGVLVDSSGTVLNTSMIPFSVPDLDCGVKFVPVSQKFWAIERPLFQYVMDDSELQSGPVDVFIAVPNINDASVIDFPAGTWTVQRDSEVDVSGITLVDDDDDSLIVSVSVIAGRLKISAPAEAVLISGVEGATLLLSGKANDVTAALASLRYVNERFDVETLTVFAHDGSVPSEASKVITLIAGTLAITHNFNPAVAGATGDVFQPDVYIHATSTALTLVLQCQCELSWTAASGVVVHGGEVAGSTTMVAVGSAQALNASLASLEVVWRVAGDQSVSVLLTTPAGAQDEEELKFSLVGGNAPTMSLSGRGGADTLNAGQTLGIECVIADGDGNELEVQLGVSAGHQLFFPSSALSTVVYGNVAGDTAFVLRGAVGELNTDLESLAVVVSAIPVATITATVVDESVAYGRVEVNDALALTILASALQIVAPPTYSTSVLLEAIAIVGVAIAPSTSTDVCVLKLQCEFGFFKLPSTATALVNEGTTTGNYVELEGSVPSLNAVLEALQYTPTMSADNELLDSITLDLTPRSSVNPSAVNIIIAAGSTAACPPPPECNDTSTTGVVVVTTGGEAAAYVVPEEDKKGLSHEAWLAIIFLSSIGSCCMLVACLVYLLLIRSPRKKTGRPYRRPAKDGEDVEREPLSPGAAVPLDSVVKKHPLEMMPESVIRPCADCGKEATTRCDECNIIICGPCDNARHTQPAFISHPRTLLPDLPECASCSTVNATLSCPDCGLDLCSACSVKIHSGGTRASHAVTTLSSTPGGLPPASPTP